MFLFLYFFLITRSISLCNYVNDPVDGVLPVGICIPLHNSKYVCNGAKNQVKHYTYSQDNCKGTPRISTRLITDFECKGINCYVRYYDCRERTPTIEVTLPGRCYGFWKIDCGIGATFTRYPENGCKGTSAFMYRFPLNHCGIFHVTDCKTDVPMTPKYANYMHTITYSTDTCVPGTEMVEELTEWPPNSGCDSREGTGRKLYCGREKYLVVEYEHRNCTGKVFSYVTRNVSLCANVTKSNEIIGEKGQRITCLVNPIVDVFPDTPGQVEVSATSHSDLTCTGAPVGNLQFFADTCGPWNSTHTTKIQCKSSTEVEITLWNADFCAGTPVQVLTLRLNSHCYFTKIFTSCRSPAPTRSPSLIPTATPSNFPTSVPSFLPLAAPTRTPTQLPTTIPSHIPTSVPSGFPSLQPTAFPTGIPTVLPSRTPTKQPTFIVNDTVICVDGFSEPHHQLNGNYTRLKRVTENGAAVFAQNNKRIIYTVRRWILLRNTTEPVGSWPTLPNLIHEPSPVNDFHARAFVHFRFTDNQITTTVNLSHNACAIAQQVCITDVLSDKVDVVKRNEMVGLYTRDFRTPPNSEIELVYRQRKTNAFALILFDKFWYLVRNSVANNFSTNYEHRWVLSSYSDPTALNRGFLSGKASPICEVSPASLLITTHLSHQVQSLAVPYVISVALFFIVLSVVGKTYAVCQKIESYRMRSVIVFGFHALDFWTDIFMSVDLLGNEDALILGVLAMVFSVVPFALNIYQLCVFNRYWLGDPQIDHNFVERSFSRIIFGTLLTGSVFGTVLLFNSHLFGLSYFQMGLSEIHMKEFTSHRLYSSVLFENIPQLGIQCYILFGRHREIVSIVIVFSFILSLISVLNAILSFFLVGNTPLRTKRGRSFYQFIITSNLLRRKFREFRSRKRAVTLALVTAGFAGSDSRSVDVYDIKPYRDMSILIRVFFFNRSDRLDVNDESAKDLLLKTLVELCADLLPHGDAEMQLDIIEVVEDEKDLTSSRCFCRDKEPEGLAPVSSVSSGSRTRARTAFF